MSTPDLTKIGTEVKDLGLLIGLLTGNRTNPDIDKNWFSSPKDGLKHGFNWPNLKPVAQSVLTKATNPIDEDGSIFQENWFPVTVSDDKGGVKPSGFYLVQKTMDPLALLGIGLHKQCKFQDGKTTFDPFVFTPIFQMPNAPGVEPLFAPDLNGPVEIGFKFKYGGKFSDKFPYTQLIFWVVFDFSKEDKKPEVKFDLKKNGVSLGAGAMLDIDIVALINNLLEMDAVNNFLAKRIIPKDDKAKKPIDIDITWSGLFKSLGWLEPEGDHFKIGKIIMPDVLGKELITYVANTIEAAIEEFLNGTNEFAVVEQKAEEEGDPSWKMSLIMNEGRYGVNVQVADVVVKSSPEVKLQIGSFTADETDWIEAAGGEAPSPMGLNFYLLKKDESGFGVSFDPQFEAVSVGLDIAKNDEEPLFDIKGYSLQQAQLRGYFSSLQKDDNDKNQWGVAAALNNVSLPLGPSTEGEGVAQTLLASGDAPAEDKEEGDKKPAVNPAFSLLAAYQANFYLQLFDEDGEPQNIVSIPLNKSFGPVALKDVGIGWSDEDKALLFQLSGGLNLNALKLDLDKLTVGVPVESPGDPGTFSLGLEGFDLTFTSGAVSMAGGFLKYKEDPDDEDEQPQYNGAVAIQAASWGITALGSFGSVEGNPSLFIFGVLNAALGGPPVFFVTALAAGFGYNRKVILPAINDVQNFPFVKAAVNPKLFEGKKNDEILQSMSKVIPVELGQYWFAAGVKFTSFEILNSFALLILQFGKKFEVDVLGLSTLQLPKTYANSKLKPYVNAQMALKATFEPEEGILAVEAQLTNNSFVIDPKCKITGGFAYYSWFKGEHADDFVVTLGGYNKNFDKTAHPHYPTVPRLAFDWKVSSSVNFSGEAYFALTPSCVMAGGKLALTYHEGDLDAWFKAVADFLISWKPFRYDIGIAISIGVSYRVNIAFIHKTITLELGVDVQMWGPEFGGQAEVRLWIISFTVNFGVPNIPAETAVTWQKFYDYFLTGENSEKPLLSPNADPLPGKTREIITINTNAGLKEKLTIGGEEIWVVDPGTFDFNAMSVFGVSKITFANGPKGEGDAPEPRFGGAFGARPIGSIIFLGNSSNFTLGLTKKGSAGFAPYSLVDWKIDTNKQNVPEALYGTVKDNKEKPAAKLIGGVTKGLGAVAPPVAEANGPREFDAEKLKFSKIPKPVYTLSATAKASHIPLKWAGSLDKIKSSISTTAKTTRDGIFTALRDLNSQASVNADMSVMAQAPENIFQDSPMLADANAQAQPLHMPERLVAAARTTLRRDAVLAEGHQLKATIIKYGFGKTGQTGVVLRGGIYNTELSKSRYRVNNSLNAFNMNPGMLQVWQLDNTSGDENLRHAGAFPVRMILFDDNLQVITDKILTTTGVSTETIPARASQMCLQGLTSASAALAGWHEESCLVLVNTKYLMGKACLIRPKRPHSVGYKQFQYDTGLVNGRALVMNNINQLEDEQPGWIETRFLTGIKQVFVLMRPEADKVAGAPELDSPVKLIYTNNEGSKTALALVPEMSGMNGEELWTAFTVPDVAGDSHFSIWVEAKSASGLELAGVAGSQKTLEGWTAELSTKLKTHDAGLNAGNAKNKLSVGLKNPLNF
ncbi:hypothetical protein IDJ77_00770 [Mucilaginibacter sp. ZT4R22]|uniref:DUF6603 domain-containing protein n=1 Tax=Mucilaginibacter pankratovii TaxID=2772110 RepID=A0ABR7WLZ8_9SPHI|nr:DUF6603 domain-containing protein [Mucilaginibacter pankratovii]MBD1362327.1 hypothetical protein [Mucilaginibacter pankratovii]